MRILLQCVPRCILVALRSVTGCDSTCPRAVQSLDQLSEGAVEQGLSLQCVHSCRVFTAAACSGYERCVAVHPNEYRLVYANTICDCAGDVPATFGTLPSRKK